MFLVTSLNGLDLYSSSRSVSSLDCGGMKCMSEGARDEARGVATVCVEFAIQRLKRFRRIGANKASDGSNES
jgi:hypothetical protein